MERETFPSHQNGRVGVAAAVWRRVQNPKKRGRLFNVCGKNEYIGSSARLPGKTGEAKAVCIASVVANCKIEGRGWLRNPEQPQCPMPRTNARWEEKHNRGSTFRPGTRRKKKTDNKVFQIFTRRREKKKKYTKGNEATQRLLEG